MITQTQESEYAMSIITGQVLISSNSRISSQPYLFNAFLSEISITGSQISDVVFSRAYILVTSSTLTLQDVTLTSLTSTDSGEVLGLSDSTLNSQDLMFSQSNCSLFLALSTEIHLLGSNFENIQGASDLFSLARSPKGEINGLEIINCTSTTSRMIFIDR